MRTPTLAQRLACRERPSGQRLMNHTWTQLLFAHWETDAAAVQRTLPKGLTADQWEGRAYVGVVPFFMRNIRPCGFPSVPWISHFLELNVRTYVHDEAGHPGVWFYSLDCSQPLAVWIARTQFGLPYFHARMRARVAADGTLAYRSRRWGGQACATFAWQAGAASQLAEPGSLEFFLIERYWLFAWHRGRLVRGQVHHAPYPLAPVTAAKIETKGLSPAGLDWSGPPMHVISSPRVEVEIFSPEFWR